jgi:hypothetical protein
MRGQLYAAALVTSQGASMGIPLFALSALASSTIGFSILEAITGITVKRISLKT